MKLDYNKINLTHQKIYNKMKEKRLDIELKDEVMNNIEYDKKEVDDFKDTEEPTITITTSEWERLKNKEAECKEANSMLEHIYRFGFDEQNIEFTEKHFKKYGHKFME
ncbi:hypothetical protein K0O13_08020 [Mammaliicoccus sciuri]|uniref:hypothetical protein n=1 Tax=Mammaliicoccus sciuri TaxID=1296 RepID=UPI001C636E94|nr:hypothetical protein [Mammaliicoccus sciuri]QYG30046.1 hypothetical protein K0O13_08020 [Mammaliicoccus sciuri]